MGDKRPTGEKEFNPLDDATDLIGQVLKRQPNERNPQVPHDERNKEAISKKAKVSVSKTSKNRQVLEKNVSQEDFVVFKFKVPRSDYAEAKRIVALLENQLRARIDLSNLGRGWITRLITAEQEILDAAQNHEELRTPNTRDRLEIAEVDHAMCVIQSVAFRRSTPIR